MVLRLSTAGLALAATVALAAAPAPLNAGIAAQPPAAVGSQQAPSRLAVTAAHILTRRALIDLHMTGAPAARDYRITAALLERAHNLDPTNQIILRHLIAACENGGDATRATAFTRTLLRLDPADTVAQLRLIAANIRELQNVDDRLAAYDRWLGPEGEAADAAVRSRLALDAALLAREQGDLKGFAERLTRAIALDATNKDAAALALTFYAQRSGEPVGTFELMLGVLAADPLDPEIHRAIARHLAQNGAYRGSERFYNTMARLLAARGQQPSEGDRVDADVVRWRVHGARPLIERYDRMIFEARQQIRRQIDDARASGRDTSDLPLPESYRLPMHGEWLRTLAAAGLGDQQLINASLDEFIINAASQGYQLQNPETRPKQISEEDALNLARGLFEEATLARLIANMQIADVAAALDQLRAAPEMDRARLARLEGWNFLRTGQLDAARRTLEPLADSDALSALGLAALSETTGDTADAIARYESIAREDAAGLPGAYAATRYAVLTGKPVPLDDVGQKLENLAAGAPEWIEAFIESPRRFQALEAKLASLEAATLEPARMTITLTNISPIPLGVSPAGPLNSRLLIAPDVQIGTDRIPTARMLQVASLERRLRLEPRQSLSIQVDPDMATLAMLLDQVSAASTRVRYRILQGFEGGGEMMIYEAGPHSLSADAGPLRRQVLRKAATDPAGLVRFVENGAPIDVAEAILVVQSRFIPFLGLTPLTAEELGAFHQALAARLPQLDTTGQLLAISLLGSPLMMPADNPVEPALKTLADPAVRALVLATRIHRPDDALLTDPLTQGDPALAELASLVRERLEDGAPSFATYQLAPPQEEQSAPAGGK